MEWLAIDKDNSEWKFFKKPIRKKRGWDIDCDFIDRGKLRKPLPLGTIHSITGKVLTWNDEPIEIDFKYFPFS